MLPNYFVPTSIRPPLYVHMQYEYLNILSFSPSPKIIKVNYVWTISLKRRIGKWNLKVQINEDTEVVVVGITSGGA